MGDTNTAGHNCNMADSTTENTRSGERHRAADESSHAAILVA